MTYFGQARQINQGQVEDVRRINLEVNGLPVDALVATSDSSRLILNFSLDIGEIGEATVWDMVELGPFRSTGGSGGPVGIKSWIRSIIILWNIDELKNQRPTSDDAASSRKKVPADYVFKDRRFTGRLRTDNDLLGAGGNRKEALVW